MATTACGPGKRFDDDVQECVPADPMNLDVFRDGSGRRWVWKAAYGRWERMEVPSQAAPQDEQVAAYDVYRERPADWS